MHFTRREFLRYSAASAVSVGAYTLYSDSIKPYSVGTCLELGEAITFPLGISAGDATHERVILWTCYQGIFPLQIAVWEAECDKNSVPIVLTGVTRKDGGFVHIDITRLKPYTSYQYAFIESDYNHQPIARSRIGKFLTAPDRNSLVPLTIGAVSCTHNSYEPVILEHAGARKDIDLFLLLGDTSYNDGCNSLQEFRDSWATNLAKKGYLDLRSSTSVIATLDDHEVCDNFNPETVSTSLLSASLKSFFENTAIRPNTNGKRQIWRSFRWGRTCEIFVLDARTERKPSTRHSSRNQYISQEQMDWLKSGLRNSDAQFKIIMNSVPIGTFPFLFERDRWEGYPQQRNEILSHIHDKEIPGVLWLSGDFHFASVARVSSEGPGARQCEILAGPGAQIPNYLAASLNASPQFDWASARNNYVTLTFDTQRYEIGLVYHGGAEDPLKTRFGEIEEIHRQILFLGNKAQLNHS